MITEDDKRFFDLSTKQAEFRVKRRALARTPERVYDRDENLKKDLKVYRNVEEKYEIAFMVKNIFKEKPPGA